MAVFPDNNLYISFGNRVCSSLGTRVLKMGGNAVDASIVTVLCSGVQNVHSCGIGGGSFMMINDEARGIQKFINCREKAPFAAHKGFIYNSKEKQKKNFLSVINYNL